MRSSSSYNFLISDDHSVVRQGVSLIVKDMFLNAQIFQAGNFEDTFKILRETDINLLILDVNFPDGNSLNILPEIKIIQPEIKVLMFSSYDENIYAMRYLNAGASGYLNKESSEEEMKHAIDTIMLSGKFITSKVRDKILDSYISRTPINPLDLLSNREIEVAHLLIKGYSNIDILELLKIKKTTVSTYKRRIFEKLQVDNLPGLIEVFNHYS
ncbi:response regulator [Flavobacterium collinsii]|uniref:LuxR family two component transcriptional regulator n=1 Tax=Flavobacterium collinsii TaxID=1114861 RepID=A0A9W4TKE4_9FLAO|nr:response regulator transcription factor [Flavobacterium collinsii]CAI2768675.1 LuxR family two component transcriptional regulator [Flavobacterium collinsii]